MPIKERPDPLDYVKRHGRLRATLPPGEFAKVSGLTVKEIREYCNNGLNPMPCYRKPGGKHLKIKTYLALQWIDECLRPDGIIRRVG